MGQSSLLYLHDLIAVISDTVGVHVRFTFAGAWNLRARVTHIGAEIDKTWTDVIGLVDQGYSSSLIFCLIHRGDLFHALHAMQ